MNIGEEICGEYLRRIKKCDFVQYNTSLTNEQGETDVIGINLSDKIIYACEVVTHLVVGMRYVKNKRPDNVERLTRKFEKAHDYVRATFRGYRISLMLWSPIVKKTRKRSRYDQYADVQEIIERVRMSKDTTVEAIINDSYQDVLDELREMAGKETKALESFMRYLQIEEYLKKHLR